MRTEGAPRPTACPDPLVGRRILVAITGSIAAVKMPLLWLRHPAIPLTITGEQTLGGPKGQHPFKGA